MDVDVRAGAVWLATEDVGALRLRGSRFEIFDRARGLPSSWAVDVVAAEDGGAYVATLRHGLVRIGGDGTVTTERGLPDDWLLHASVDAASGALWVGTQGGAARLGPGPGDAAVLGSSGRSGLPDLRVHAVAVTRAGTWLGTEGGTLFVEGGKGN